ncbi:MAG: glycosyltransferase, partial [Bacteroidales bacterium]|nr:glycosyltransferase [Bacteroidales bacterium]
YWNAGWDGDYMLLAHDIPDEELKWFIDKGILVKKCKPPRDNIFYSIKMKYSTVVLNKFYIFSVEFKKWEHIVFLDCDMIVKASLDRLVKIKGFGAVDADIRLSEQFLPRTQIYDEIKNNYNLNKKSFNAGVLAFSTDVICDGTYEKLIGLFNRYENVARCLEETILNIYFYKNRIKIPMVYNHFISVLMFHKIKHNKTKAIIFHFMRIYGDEKFRPWYPENPFYNEWVQNLKKADFIDLNRVQSAKKWSVSEIVYYSILNKIYMLYAQKIEQTTKHFYGHIKLFLVNTGYKLKNLPGRMIGLGGSVIKGISPKLYKKIKKQISIKNEDL